MRRDPAPGDARGAGVDDAEHLRIVASDIVCNSAETDAYRALADGGGVFNTGELTLASAL